MGSGLGFCLRMSPSLFATPYIFRRLQLCLFVKRVDTQFIHAIQMQRIDSEPLDCFDNVLSYLIRIACFLVGKFTTPGNLVSVVVRLRKFVSYRNRGIGQKCGPPIVPF